MDARPMLVELQWVHPCFCIDSAEQVHEGRISLISPLVYGKGFATGLYEIESGGEITEFISELREQKKVRGVEVIEKSGSKALIYLRSQPDSLLIETIGKTGCIPLEPSLTKNGVDSCAVYVPSCDHLRSLYSMLKDNYEVKLLGKRFLKAGESKQSTYLGLKEMLEFKSLAATLSPRKLEVLSYASRKGYFDSPKRTSIGEIASALGLRPATASEHLRKVQAKIMPFVAQAVQAIR